MKDTVVIGLISNNVETAYLNQIKMLTSRCNDNSLELNIAKTKELAIDFRRDKQRLTEHPWCTGGDSEPLKYLGVVISEDLSGTSHNSNLVKKASVGTILES